MSSRRAATGALAGLALAGCGFRPMYGPRPEGAVDVDPNLAKTRGGLKIEIRIVVLRGLRFEQVHGLRKVDARIPIQGGNDFRDVAPCGNGSRRRRWRSISHWGSNKAPAPKPIG